MPENAENTFRGAVHSSAGSRAGEEAAGRNRRQEMRLPCDPGGVLLESVAHPEPVEGQIVEVSKSGLQLRLEIPVAAGALVRISRAGMAISGQIRYCRPNDAGSFDTGVAIFDVQQMQ